MASRTATAGTGVLTDDAQMGRETATRYLLPRQNFDELLFATRWIFGGKGHDLASAVALAGIHGLLHSRQGDRLIVLDSEQNFLGVDNMGKDFGSLDNGGGVDLHQGIIGTDIGFAFGAVNDQRANGLGGRAVEFDRSRKARPAHAGNARQADSANKRGPIDLPPVGQPLERDPVVVAVTAQFNTPIS